MQGLQIRLTDVHGRNLRDLFLDGKGTGFDLDLGGLPNGVYWLSIQTAGGRTGRRVVVAK